MSWGTELNILRRYLRDPAGNIWGERLLRSLWDEVSRDLQDRVALLEDVAVIPVPPRFQYSHTHDWERGLHAGTAGYHAMRQQGGHYATCYRWEVQQKFALQADVSDEGTATFTHPWEAWAGLAPGMPVPFPLPANAHRLKGCYYDDEPITHVDRKRIEQTDPSWMTREGEAYNYSQSDDYTGHIFLYPRPSSVTWDDLDNDPGMLTAVEDDTIGAETGMITQRTGSVLGGDFGVALDTLGTADNVLVYYEVQPLEVTGLGGETGWPEYCDRFVRYGVLERAFKANTDGRIPSLSRYWGERYRAGVKTLNRFAGRRKRDIDYRLRAYDVPARRIVRLPRLPDGYPASL